MQVRQHARLGVLGLALICGGLGFAHAQSKGVGTPAVAAASEVKVEGAWIRATVKGQQVTGGFMDLTSSQAATLMGFESMVAKRAELHEMVMDGDVMRMRALDGLALPAGTKVSLKPGSHHLMLLDLKQALSDGSTVPITLLIKGADGKVFKQMVSVPVKAQQMAHPHGDHGGHHHAH